MVFVVALALNSLFVPLHSRARHVPRPGGIRVNILPAVRPAALPGMMIEINECARQSIIGPPQPHGENAAPRNSRGPNEMPTDNPRAGRAKTTAGL